MRFASSYLLRPDRARLRHLRLTQTALSSGPHLRLFADEHQVNDLEFSQTGGRPDKRRMATLMAASETLAVCHPVDLAAAREPFEGTQVVC